MEWSFNKIKVTRIFKSISFEKILSESEVNVSKCLIYFHRIGSSALNNRQNIFKVPALCFWSFNNVFGFHFFYYSMSRGRLGIFNIRMSSYIKWRIHWQLIEIMTRIIVTQETLQLMGPLLNVKKFWTYQNHFRRHCFHET